MSDIESQIIESAEEAAQNYLDSNMESEVETQVDNYISNLDVLDSIDKNELDKRIQDMIDKSIKKALKILQGDREYDFDKWEGTNGTDD